MEKREQSSAVAMRSVLGRSRTRSVLGGDDENEMQGSDLDGGDIGARLAVGCQDWSLSMHGWRLERWIDDEGGVG